MDEDIDIIFKKQADALPFEIKEYIASGVWQKELNTIIQHFNMSEETTSVLEREVVLVLTGLVHPEMFRNDFANDINGVDDVVINAIVAEVSSSIFNPISPFLEKFLIEQDASPDLETQHEKEKITIPSAPLLIDTPREPQKIQEKEPPVIPENLPTGEVVASVVAPEQSQNNTTPIPTPISISKEQTQNAIAGFNEQTSPFEEKMKKVFTGGMVDRDGLVLEQKTVPTETPHKDVFVPRPPHDPYREPIE